MANEAWLTHDAHKTYFFSSGAATFHARHVTESTSRSRQESCESENGAHGPNSTYATTQKANAGPDLETSFHMSRSCAATRIELVVRRFSRDHVAPYSAGSRTEGGREP